jgi:predicted DNA-binding WGR domain protein
MQPEVFPDRLHLRRVDPARRMQRFYEMAVQRDLLGGAALLCEWGRIGSPGKVRREVHRDEGQALEALLARARAKARRGYRLP